MDTKYYLFLYSCEASRSLGKKGAVSPMGLDGWGVVHRGPPPSLSFCSSAKTHTILDFHVSSHLTRTVSKPCLVSTLTNATIRIQQLYCRFATGEYTQSLYTTAAVLLFTAAKAIEIPGTY